MGRWGGGEHLNYDPWSIVTTHRKTLPAATGVPRKVSHLFFKYMWEKQLQNFYTNILFGSRPKPGRGIDNNCF